jgi:anthranilate phosphoribosyltransferase
MTTLSFAEAFAEVAAGAQAQGGTEARGEPLDAVVVRRAFDAILSGAWTPVQTGAFAVAVRMHGETKEILVAAAESMRAAMTAVAHERDVVVDTCGTGGDGACTLNISTAAAVVVAACGVAVAKHGNRSVSSRCGSADVVEALGIPLGVPPEQQTNVLRETGIAFLFAPAHHPALRHAAQARKELGVRTIFNAVGPLANPARATHQLVGVYDDALRPLVAAALGALGVRRAWVVRSEDGLDEVSPSAPTHVSELAADGSVTERVFAPEDFGLSRISRSALAGSSTEENARAVAEILNGAPHVATNAVLLNAASALAVAGVDDDLRACTEIARRAIASGRTRDLLEAWRTAATKWSTR